MRHIKWLLSIINKEFNDQNNAKTNIAGTSKEYRGDSAVNVFGDMVSCALGYNFAKFLSRRGSFHLPLIVFFLNELGLGLDIRDNFVLIIMQLLFPNEK